MSLRLCIGTEIKKDLKTDLDTKSESWRTEEGRGRNGTKAHPNAHSTLCASSSSYVCAQYSPGYNPSMDCQSFPGLGILKINSSDVCKSSGILC